MGILQSVFTTKSLVRLVYITCGALLLFYSTRLLTDAVSLGGLPTNLPWLAVGFSLVCYLLSHVFRVLRLIILAEDPRISVRELMIEQYKANGVNLALPFRLGEAYRVIFFKKFFGSYYRSFIFLLTERIFDFAMILAIFYMARYFAKEWHAAFDYVNYFTIIMFVGIFGFFFVAEECLSILHRVLLSRYTTPIGVKLIKVSGQVLRAIHDVKQILSKRIWACLGFTLTIWGLEVLGFSMFYSVLGGQVDALLSLSSLVFLSSLLPSGPVGYGGVQLAFHWVGQIWNAPALVAYSIWYNMFIFLPGILLALFLFINGSIWKKKD